MTGYVGPWRLWTGSPGDPAIKNAWGTDLNANTNLLMAGATGTASVDLTGVTTFTLSANNGTADQSRPLIQSYTGTPTGNCTVTIPNVQKVGWAINGTSGGHNVLLTSGGGTQATIPPDSRWYWFSCDGSGNVSLPSIGYAALNTTGNVSVGGTLAVTGVATAANGTSGSRVVNFSQFAQSVASPGYITLPGGVMIQWGAATSASQDFAVTFPIAFPNAVFNIQATVQNTSFTTSNAVAVSGASTTAFAAHTQGGVTIYWMAIGH